MGTEAEKEGAGAEGALGVLLLLLLSSRIPGVWAVEAARAGAPDSWATARGGSQAGGGDPWGAGDKQNDNQGVWQQDGWGANANADDGGVWGNAEQGGRGGGTWGDQGQAGGGGGAWGRSRRCRSSTSERASVNKGTVLAVRPQWAQSDSWRDWTQMSGRQGRRFTQQRKAQSYCHCSKLQTSRETVLSGKQQHSQILQSLFGAFKGGRQDNPGDQGKKGGKGEGKKGKKGKKQQTPYASPWHAINVIEEEPEEEFENIRRV